MKRMLSLLLLFSIITTKDLNSVELQGPNKITRKEEAKYFKLNSDFLKYLDGVSNRLDGSAIGEVIQVRKLIQDLKNGTLSSKPDNAILSFQNKKTTISELCKIESRILKQYYNEGDFAVKAALNNQLEELRAELKKAKHSFIQATLKFMKRIEPAKPIVVKIMEKSCSVRNIKPHQTVMLDWANTNGNEEAVFNDRIKNFPEFSIFLNQVYNFLSDLLKSCPKGFAQYLRENKRS